MIATILALALTAASPGACRHQAIEKVIKDADWTAPFVLVTTTGNRLRLAGQDFIDPREWRGQDKLEICKLLSPFRDYKIEDQTRGEILVGRLISSGADH